MIWFAHQAAPTGSRLQSLLPYPACYNSIEWLRYTSVHHHQADSYCQLIKFLIRTQALHSMDPVFTLAIKPFPYTRQQHTWHTAVLFSLSPVLHVLFQYYFQWSKPLLIYYKENEKQSSPMFDTGKRTEKVKCPMRDVNTAPLSTPICPSDLCKFILDVDGLWLDDSPSKLLLHTLQRPIVTADLQRLPLCFERFHGVWWSHHGRPRHLVLHGPCLISRWKSQMSNVTSIYRFVWIWTANIFQSVKTTLQWAQMSST